MNITIKFAKFFVVIENRNGFGVDVEACPSRPIMLYDGEETTWAIFDGMVFLLPFINISIGNCFQLVEDEE
jgi:hypothetical protein